MQKKQLKSVSHTIKFVNPSSTLHTNENDKIINKNKNRTP